MVVSPLPAIVKARSLESVTSDPGMGIGAPVRWRTMIMTLSPWMSVLLDGGLDARLVTMDCCTKDALGAHK